MAQSSPTLELWEFYQAAFDFFNDALFDSKLPQCLLTLSAKGRSHGHFTPKRWSKNSNSQSHEIALNPDLLRRRDTLIFEILVRQMVSLWQHDHGTPSRNDYHNAEWSAKMESIGLVPSDTGEPGGQKTGFRIRHYLQPESKIAQVLTTIPTEFFPWRAEPKNYAGVKCSTRVKYTCPECGANVWGSSPKLKIKCFTNMCNARMQTHEELEQTSSDYHRAELPSMELVF
ncbi:MAG: hypothetical protein KME49_22570 [Brasilonema octagenarum HA4186-MV1]|nr:hypothetical protein [Brasilonema octagenarum HA4186-MV1]